MLPDLNEAELIKKYLQGDEAALENLINHYLKPVYGFIFHLVNDARQAEDLTQEVFVRMWHNLKKFDQEKKFSTWIFSIAKNAAIDYWRKKKAVPFAEFIDESEDNYLEETLADEAPLPDELFDRNNLSAEIQTALNQLPIAYRLVLLLYYQNDLTFQEIADSLDKSINTVKSQHRRALLALRKILTA